MAPARRFAPNYLIRTAEKLRVQIPGPPRVGQRNVHEMLGHEPRLQLVAPNDAAHDQNRDSMRPIVRAEFESTLRLWAFALSSEMAR